MLNTYLDESNINLDESNSNLDKLNSNLDESNNNLEESNNNLQESNNNLDESNINSKLTNQIGSIINNLSTFKTHITTLQSQLKNLEKTIKKEFKTLSKQVEKNKSKGNRKPSGFAKPKRVSPELSKFLNKNNSIELARTEVTQYIIKYIQENKLQNPDNLKIIEPDDKLKNLLELKDNDKLTFFNIQKYMNKHFI